MEEIGYVNFFRFISAQKARIPLIETAAITNESVEVIACNDEQGFTKKKQLQKPYHILSYLQKLCEDNDVKNRLRETPNEKICYFYKRCQRKLYDEAKLHEMLNRSRFGLNVDLVQKFTDCESEKILTLKVVYMKKEYMAEMTCGKCQITDPITSNTMLDIAIIMIHTLEHAQLKRVVLLSIEFQKDRNGVLWVANVPRCVLVEAKLTLDQPMNSEEDVNQLIKSIPNRKEKHSSVKRRVRENKYYEIRRPVQKATVEAKYVFRRGQLRNSCSNLDSPIRINQINCNDELNSDNLVYKSWEASKNETQKAMNSDIPQLTCEQLESVDKSTVNEIFKTFFMYQRQESKVIQREESKNFDTRASFKNQDPMKQITSPKRVTSILNHKTLPRLVRGPKRNGSDFMELIMKTYCKEKKISSDCIPEEFGITTSITTEDFRTFLSNVDPQAEESRRVRLLQKVASEENHLLSSGPQNSSFPRKKFEDRFVSIILNKHKDIFTSLPKLKSKRTLSPPSPPLKIKES